MEFVVRRAWADQHVNRHLQKWQQAITPQVRLATAQRRKRLETWRRERSASAGPDDRVIAWIDEELARLNAAGEPQPSTLIKVRLPRSDVRGPIVARRRMSGCSAWRGSQNCRILNP